MALSYNAYTATSGQTVFAFTFPVIANDHVKVSVNGTDLASNQYTVTTSPSSQVTLTSGATAGQIVRVYRQTPGRTTGSAVPLVDFVNGSVLSEDDLDKNSKQLLYLVQESDDTGSGALGPSLDGTQWDAESKKIQNLASPVASTDAATKAYVDGATLYGTGLSSPQSWTLSGNDSTTNFTLSPAPLTTDANMFLVEIGGVIQRPIENYSITAPNTLVFTSAPKTGSGNIVVRNIGAVRNVASFADNVSFGSNISVAGTASVTGNTTVTGSVTSSSFVGPVTGNVTGNLTGNVTGNVVATNLTGTLQTAAQPNITSTGSLTVPSLNVSGSITGSTVGALASSLLPGGAVLQVITAVNSTAKSNLTTNWVDTGLTATITPKRSNSKILVIATHAFDVMNISGKTASASAIIVRGSTMIESFPYINYIASTPVIRLISYATLCSVDTPGTTSATTYKTQFRPATVPLTETDLCAVQTGSATAYMFLIEVAV